MVSVLAVPHAGQVIVDSRITVISLKHRADVGGARRVGEDRLLQIVGGKVMAQRETKEVDDFIWAPRMHPLPSSISVLNPYTVSATRRAVYQSGTFWLLT